MYVFAAPGLELLIIGDILQVVFNTTRGRYPFSIAEFHSQAGLQAAIKHMESDTKNLANLKSEANFFYPPHMRTTKGGHKVTKFFKKSAEGKGLGDELIKSYEEASNKCPDPHQLKILYLQLCWHKPYYASVFFKGIIEKAMQPYLKLLAPSEKQIVVAVNTECIHIMAASSPSVSYLLELCFVITGCLLGGGICI